jgi:seryl-tRNA synthetase
MEVDVISRVLEIDQQRRGLLIQAETLKNERNTVSKEISQVKDPTERKTKIDAMRLVGDQIAVLDDQIRKVEADQLEIVSGLPNLPAEDTPYGKDDSENIVVRTIGELPAYDFTPVPHWDLGPKLGIINFDQGVKVTGSRFYVLSGAGARLQRALIAYMLDLHIQQGYREQYLPFMVKGDVLYGSGQLPKFADNLYRDHEEDFWMVPTAEVPLTGIHMNDILEDASLPLRYTAYTPCFRREKMSAGRDVRGIKRGHQVDKVEMYI